MQIEGVPPSQQSQAGGHASAAVLQIYNAVSSIYQQLSLIRNNGDSGGTAWNDIISKAQSLNASALDLPPSPLLNEGFSDLQEVLPNVYDSATAKQTPSLHDFMASMDNAFSGPTEEICTAMEKMGLPGQGQLHAFQLINCSRLASDQPTIAWMNGGDPEGTVKEQMNAYLDKMNDLASKFPPSSGLKDAVGNLQTALENTYTYALSTPSPSNEELTQYFKDNVVPIHLGIDGALASLGHSISAFPA